MKRICMAVLVVITGVTGLSAQVMNSQDPPVPKPKATASGALNPSFWIGGKAVVVAGKNFETGAAGLSYSPNDVWGSFNFAFLDSQYDVPKLLSVPEDPTIWSGSFTLRDATYRVNSYQEKPDINSPWWRASVQGQGFRFGVLSQGGTLGGGDPDPKKGGLITDAALTITGADRALVIGDRVAGARPFLSTASSESLVSVAYPVTGLAFAGWESPDLKVLFAFGSQGKGAVKEASGWAGALNLEVSPWGQASIDNPLTLKLVANGVAGTGYKDTSTGKQDGNPIGTGLAAQLDWALDDDLVVSPQLAFDLRLNDTQTPGVTLAAGTLKTDWKAAAGVLVSLSPKRWVGDDWAELPGQGIGSQYFEYAKIQKSAYVQVLADLGRAKVGEAQRDVNLILRFEEPDGMVGFDENLGVMVEYSRLNLLQANAGPAADWSLAGRVSYDLVSHRYSPYLRVMTDSTMVLQFRTGVQFAIIPGCAAEVTYMTTNLTNKGATPDAGRLELMVGFSSDSAYNRTAKNMSFNYTGN